MQFTKGWHVMYTKSRHERKASRQLLEKKIIHLVPMIKVPSKNKNVIQVMETPIFPSYVFVYLDSAQVFYDSARVDGCIRYVKFGNEIARVSEDIITNLRIISECGKRVEVHEGTFQVGQRLTITHGPLYGMKCEVLRQQNCKSVTVTLCLLGRVVIAVIPAQHLSVTGYTI